MPLEQEHRKPSVNIGVGALQLVRSSDRPLCKSNLPTQIRGLLHSWYEADGRLQTMTFKARFAPSIDLNP